MIKIFFLFLSLNLSFLVTSCTNKKELNQKLDTSISPFESYKAEYYGFRFPFDPATIRSVGTYTILQHLTRGLVILDKNVQYRGNLATSWKISNDHKTFKFKISNKYKYSNGEVIKPSDIVCTIKRQMTINKATHFDFGLISSVTSRNDTLTINLSKKMPGFIHHLLHPEFGILHPSQCNKKHNDVEYSITSGPYTLIQGKKNRAELKKNPHFQINTGPNNLIIKSEEIDSYTAFKNNELDFLIASSSTDFAMLDKLKKENKIKYHYPHYGFTYWLSINEFNPDLKKRSARRLLSKALKLNYRLDIPQNMIRTWGKTNQLFLPDGGGRLSHDELNDIWYKITNESGNNKFSEVNLLLRKNLLFKDSIISAIKAAGFKVNLHEYSSLKEFEKMSLKDRSKYHLIQINNDFSSADLYENIQVTLNEKRPLAFLDTSLAHFNYELDRLAAESNLELRHKITSKIEKKLLADGFIFPLALYKAVYVYKTDHSLEDWSKYFPEVSFWKVKKLR